MDLQNYCFSTLKTMEQTQLLSIKIRFKTFREFNTPVAAKRHARDWLRRWGNRLQANHGPLEQLFIHHVKNTKKTPVVANKPKHVVRK